MIQEAIAQRLGAPTEIWRIIHTAAGLSGMSTAEITGPYRGGDACWVRFAVMWAIRRSTGCSLPKIGRVLGGRDHTTIVHGLRRAKGLRKSDGVFRLFADILTSDSRVMIAGDIGLTGYEFRTPWTPPKDAIEREDEAQQRIWAQGNRDHLRALAKHHNIGIYAGAMAA